MNILVVCTGNTCRSPMAEAILRHLLDASGKQDISVMSAGVMAYPGQPPSQEAVQVMEERELDISSHRSRLMTPDLIADADLILCMERRHLAAVRALGGDRARLLGGDGEIQDPFGRGLDSYRSCADQLFQALSAFVASL